MPPPFTQTDFVVVDTPMLAHQAFYGSGMELRNRDGRPTGIYSGVWATVAKIQRELQPSHILVAFEGETLDRRTLFPAYKAGRSAKLPDFMEQMKFLPQFCERMGWTVLQQDGLEADDMIASFATQASKRGKTTAIFTKDKDILQLMDDNTGVYQREKGTYFFVTEDEVVERYGVPPKLVSEVLFLAGDTSDNIPGVHKLGVKGAAALVNKYGSADAVYDHLEDHSESLRGRLVSSRESYLLSKKLVQLVTNVQFPESHFEPAPPPDRDVVIKVFNKLDMAAARSRFERDSDPRVAKPATPPPSPNAVPGAGYGQPTRLPAPPSIPVAAPEAPALAGAGQLEMF